MAAISPLSSYQVVPSTFLSRNSLMVIRGVSSRAACFTLIWPDLSPAVTVTVAVRSDVVGFADTVRVTFWLSDAMPEMGSVVTQSESEWMDQFWLVLK